MQETPMRAKPQDTDHIRLRDRLHIGNHVLKRYTDVSLQIGQRDRWELVRVTPEGETRVVGGEGHDLTEIKWAVDTELDAQRAQAAGHVLEWHPVVTVKELDRDGATARIEAAFLSLAKANAYIEFARSAKPYASYYAHPDVFPTRPEEGQTLHVREGLSSELAREIARLRFGLDHGRFYGIARWQGTRMPRVGHQENARLGQDHKGSFVGRSVQPDPEHELGGPPLPLGSRLYVLLEWDRPISTKNDIHQDCIKGTIIGATSTWSHAYEAMSELNAAAHEHERALEEALDRTGRYILVEPPCFTCSETTQRVLSYKPAELATLAPLHPSASATHRSLEHQQEQSPEPSFMTKVAPVPAREREIKNDP
jgi:hypothetical protein